ncbi:MULTISPECIES: hypothetical protein [unclassified Coleofasciculus]|uniref:hypothetical protein n=1 Tax=unclassified Coleofasciculus TaxID=2692782 RepID=UPI001880589A|nr:MULTISPECIES: hypothetical protein [unclassified Coleofasciculus]MBE9124577.1 hypothetical protein [Coleofasciculus sp. LEGE 07081]MBE9150366.1 hypothetical protein [Coleofasciculus sp. LEGE 07092]
MQVPVKLLPGALSELYAQATISGKITKADRYGLMAALLDDSLTDEEQESVERLLYSLQRGRMKIVDEISAL